MVGLPEPELVSGDAGERTGEGYAKYDFSADGNKGD